MKTINSIAAIIAALTITVSANAKVINGQPTSQPIANNYVPNSTFYYSDKSTNDLKYEYVLDDNGRVTSKIGYKKDKQTEVWTPLHMYFVVYGNEETVVTYALWNENKHLFNKGAQQYRYDAKEYPEVIKVPKK